MKLSRDFGARRNPVTYLVPRTRFLARIRGSGRLLMRTTWCNGEGRVLVFQLSQRHLFKLVLLFFLAKILPFMESGWTRRTWLFRNKCGLLQVKKSQLSLVLNIIIGFVMMGSVGHVWQNIYFFISLFIYSVRKTHLRPRYPSRPCWIDLPYAWA